MPFFLYFFLNENFFPPQFSLLYKGKVSLHFCTRKLLKKIGTCSLLNISKYKMESNFFFPRVEKFTTFLRLMIFFRDIFTYPRDFR